MVKGSASLSTIAGTARAIVVVLSVLASLVVAVVPASAQNSRFFSETGFSVSNDRFWDFFQRRGGLRTFGYPVSREFVLDGFTVQIFQRKVMQLQPNGSVALLNLLDTAYMPFTRFNNSVVPPPDPRLTEITPSPSDPAYAEKIVQFVRSYAPDVLEGYPVNFFRAFSNTVTYQDAFPNAGEPESLVPLLNLELNGAPTSYPAFDQNNRNFIFQRFQRGILHYDATSGTTQWMLLADYFKSILTGKDLPPDLEEQARGSRFYRQYNRAKPRSIDRPELLPNSDLGVAFEREDRPIAPANLPPSVSVTGPAGGASVNVGFTLTVSASDDLGLKNIWWRAIGSGDSELDSLHVYDCQGSSQCTRQWSVRPTRPGTLSIRVGAVDTGEVSAEEKTLQVTVVPGDFRANLEKPEVNSSVGGVVKIEGWAIDMADKSGPGIDAVHVYLDGGPGQGLYLGPATYGVERPDVATHFGDARFTKSGFVFSWDSKDVRPGAHTIHVLALSRVSGQWNSLSAPINLVRIGFPNDPLVTVEIPTAGSTVTLPTATVVGWAVDRNAESGTGIDEVRVYLDGPMSTGILLASTTSFVTRTDVGRALGSSRFDNSGFSLSYSSRSIRAGTHTLYVYVHSSYTKQWKSVAIDINVPAS